MNWHQCWTDEELIQCLHGGCAAERCLARLSGSYLIVDAVLRQPMSFWPSCHHILYAKLHAKLQKGRPVIFKASKELEACFRAGFTRSSRQGGWR